MPSIGMPKFLEYSSDSDRARFTRFLPSGSLPFTTFYFYKSFRNSTIPILLSMGKTLWLVPCTKSLEVSIFSAASMTPSLHLTPKIVLDKIKVLAVVHCFLCIFHLEQTTVVRECCHCSIVLYLLLNTTLPLILLLLLLNKPERIYHFKLKLL